MKSSFACIGLLLFLLCSFVFSSIFRVSPKKGVDKLENTLYNKLKG
nr:MAG TPA: hypothetical protein [Bacteriophage sp.]